MNGTKDIVPRNSKPSQNQDNYFLNLLHALDYDPFHPPLADLLRAYHELDGQWVIASPVHWEATHNDAMITAESQELELTDKESRLWFTEIAQFLKDDNFKPVYHDAQTWLFNVDNKPVIRSRSPRSLLHQSLMPVLANLDNTLFWQRLITELQMYLSAHPLNQQRKTAFSINGLWFWGEGDFILDHKKPIETDDKTLLALLNKPFGKLTTDINFKKNHLLFIHDPAPINFSKLEQKTRKHTVHWYWNNLAYTNPASHWWSRLGR
ncbi:hypothetical protein [Legionella fairfieldensis]|uniref:hypothetical protein n=1 Tax=Legionella fairfieldensis TaxID=45064 RepID=UPI00104183EC|nr:hypothetical protein [Legionella fairfieldensis]